MALLIPLLGSCTVGIQQKLAAAKQFTGVAHTGVQTAANGCSKFSDQTAVPANADGGLFDFENNEPIIVTQVFASFGTAVTTVTLSVVNLDKTTRLPIAGEKFLRFSDSAVDLIALPNIDLRLLKHQALMLETTGGGAAKVAIVYASVERASVR